jgi:4-hydroxy-tetrahydrodipicolinate reductase
VSDKLVRVAIAGAAGRMGRALVAACAAEQGLALTAAIEAPGSDALGSDAGVLAGIGSAGVLIGDDLGVVVADFDVLIDFTRPRASLTHLACCAEAGRAAVIGTTGFDAAERAEIGALAGRTPVVLAPNMSVGVNVCLALLDIAARTLGEDYDIEVVEAHHRHKVDAPSGTAVRMGEVLAAARGRDLEGCAIWTREGETGPRPRGAIGFASLRAGEIFGEHTVYFASAGERIEITHRAASRSNFAHGAVRAAGWLHGRPPGLYDMHDVLALR